MFLEISQNSQEHICARVSILIKLPASGLQLYLKRDPGTGVFLWILRDFWEHLSYKTLAGDCFCNLFFIYTLIKVAIEKCLLNMFVQRKKQNSWKILVKVFIATKVAGCRALSLLKLTLSLKCFKSSAKITYYLVF